MVTVKKIIPILIFPLACTLLFITCKKNTINEPVPTAMEQPYLNTEVKASVSGFVTNESGAPVNAANVQYGTLTTITDQFGYFEIKDATVKKNAAFVTVNQPGYFKGIKTFITEDHKMNFCRIKLIPKTNAGTINASVGGNVALSNGINITLPSNAVVVASGSTAYNGSVNIAASWINPEASDLTEIMPGDLRGLDSEGLLKGLTTYGMVAVELTGDAGQLLQIANGKKATITMPLSGTLSAAAPQSIPLWYFDESNGLWKQDGTANKNGNNYVGEVSHFSFWNCDLPNATVPLTFTVVDAGGNPIANTHVEIVPTTANLWAHIGGWTDSTGYVSVLVTANTGYNLSIYGSCTSSSGTPNYSQSFSVTTTPVNLGNIVLPTSNISTVTGTITDCSGNPVTNGDIIVVNGYYYARYPVDNNGNYSFSIVICDGSMAVNLIAEDINNSQQNTPVAYTLVTGTNTISNIQACSINTNTFIHCTVDGITTNLAPPVDTLSHTGNGGTAISYINGSSNTWNATFVGLGFNNAGIAAGSPQMLTNFSTSAINNGLETTGFAILVHITEYGPVGEYIAGNFSGTVYDSPSGPPIALPYQVVCSFRVRRTF